MNVMDDIHLRNTSDMMSSIQSTLTSGCDAVTLASAQFLETCCNSYNNHSLQAIDVVLKTNTCDSLLAAIDQICNQMKLSSWDVMRVQTSTLLKLNETMYAISSASAFNQY